MRKRFRGRRTSPRPSATPSPSEWRGASDSKFSVLTGPFAKRLLSIVTGPSPFPNGDTLRGASAWVAEVTRDKAGMGPCLNLEKRSTGGRAVVITRGLQVGAQAI